MNDVPSTSRSNPALQKLLFIGKVLFVGFLILVMYLPMGMVQSLIDERNQRRDSADREVIQTWGRDQTLGGPVLTVPYLTYSEISETDAKGRERKKVVSSTHYAHFLPEVLEVNGMVHPELRYRGMYQVLLYQSDLLISGKFLKPDFSTLRIPEQDVRWEDAVLSVGIPDMRAIQEQVNVLWNQQSTPFSPANATTNVFSSGIQAPVGGEAEHEVSFSFKLKLAGSQTLQFLPFGKETRVTLHSDWRDPSFIGAYLPDQREVDDRGFTARWQVLHLGRNYPQQWQDKEIAPEGFQDSAFGVSLIFPVDTYQKTTRSAKYAILFILLSFVTFFLFEIFHKFRIHPVQYLLVGFGLCLFYLLLLSLSEHLGFGTAYLMATLGTVLLIGAYSSTVLKTGNRALVMGGVLGGLYGYLYILLQLQDFALLMGAVGLFVILAAIMLITRKVDWYGLSAAKPAASLVS